MKLNYIIENLYVLKTDYGESIDIYKETVVVDFGTGRKIPTRLKLHIDNAIVLPSIDILRGRNVYEQAFLQSQRNPVGSSLEVSDRIVIVDATDVPDDFDIQPNDYLIIFSEHGNTRYDIKTVTQYEFDAGYILSLKETVGAKLAQIIDLYLKNRITISQQVNVII
jgi:hypothetical protein